MKAPYFPVVSVLAFLLLVTACQEPAPEAPVVQQQDIFTTVISLSLYGHPQPDVFTKIFDRLHQIDTLMSDYRADSELSRVSQAAGTVPLKVSPETMTVVKTGLSESVLSGGIFDPTIGPVSHLWDVGNPHDALPSATQIAAAKALVNWKNVVVDETSSTILLKNKGMILDLGGVAKGYAMDEAIRIARASGVKAGIFNMGNSSIGLLGLKPGEKPWVVGIQNPFEAQNAYFATVQGSNITVETSGPYEKFFVLNGKRYHHIMDPRTGAPADSGLEQVTLVLPLDTKLADGLSTTCFILGREKGMALIESLPDAAAIFVTSDHQVYLTSRMGTRFNLKDKSFTVIAAKGS